MDPQPSTGPTVPVPAAKKSKEKLPTTKPSSIKPKRPGYSEMVMKAVLEMKDRKGSSRQAIQNLVAKTNSIDATPAFHRALSKTIRNMVQREALLQASGVGANGRFRVNREAIKRKESVAKNKAKLAAAKLKAKGAASRGKKSAPKKSKTLKKNKKVVTRRVRKSPVKKRMAMTKNIKRKSPKKNLKKAITKKRR